MDYSCKRCINRGSVLCELCVSVTSPDGCCVKKPSMFVNQTVLRSGSGRRSLKEYPTSDESVERMAKYLLDSIRHRVPIPVAVVVEYNRKTEKEI